METEPENKALCFSDILKFFDYCLEDREKEDHKKEEEKEEEKKEDEEEDDKKKN